MSMMLVILIAAGASLVFGLFLLMRNRETPPPQRHLSQPASRALAHPSAPASPTPPVGDHAPLADPQPPAAPVAPPLLAGLTWLEASALDPVRQAAITLELRAIPRPPNALHDLLSARFLAEASAAQVSELIMSEPAIAAKVLAVVNAPVHGLSTPITGIGQAITFLGMNAVRGLCQQYLLRESFPAGNAEARQRFEAIWEASGHANDLAGRLAQALRLTDQATIATAVTLSFIGRAALVALGAQRATLPSDATLLTLRLPAEQALFGLGAAEIGALLMQAWNLPDALVERVRAIDHTLLRPLTAIPAEMAMATAVSYLAARLGERLAAGHLTRLAEFDLLATTDPDFHVLRHSLPADRLATLAQQLTRLTPARTPL